MASRVIRRIRRDSLPVLCFIILYSIMSYPLVFKLGEIVPFFSGDTYQAAWLNWWAWGAISTGQDYNFTPLLFAPNGLDYTLQPPRFPSLPIWIPIYELFGEPTAYNLSVSIEVVIKAYGMYLFGLYLFKCRIPAWVMGAFYAFGLFSLQMALQQPYTGATEWIPFFMLAYVYGIDRILQGARAKSVIGIMVLASFLFVMNVYMNIKIGIFAMMVGGIYVLFALLRDQLWRIRLFWQGMAVFTLTVLILCAPLILPIISSDNFTSAFGSVRRDKVLDVMQFVKPRLDRPWLYTRMVGALGDDLEWLEEQQHLPTVGLVSLAFAWVGVRYAIRRDRGVFVWVLMAVILWVFSLGEAIQIGTVHITRITPASFLLDTVVMGVLRNTDRFALVFMFPFSVLIGYGLYYRLQNLELNRTNKLLLVVAIVMLFYGTSTFPIPHHAKVYPKYIDELNNLPDGSIVNLPLGRAESKFYMAVQRYHQRPMIEGMIARTPKGTYDYIDSLDGLNLPLYYTPDLNPEVVNGVWEMTMQRLRLDGFRYVIVHKYLWGFHKVFITPDNYFETLGRFPNIYEDELVQIYDIHMLVEQPFVAVDN